MKKDDLLSILITFVVGLFAGGYLYITGFAPIEAVVSTPIAEEISEFSIVGDVYGGCRNTCPSFKIVEDGSYRYFYTPAAGAEQSLREGSLPYQLYRNLRNVITESELLKQSRTIVPSTCNSYVDGIDVVYEITLNGRLYIIDSCGTAAEGESELWMTLSQVWSYYETLGNNS